MQWPEDDFLIAKPTVNGVFMSFFVKGAPITKTVIPMIRQLGSKYGMSILSSLSKTPEEA
jgi:arginyl-tRNA synthetase